MLDDQPLRRACMGTMGLCLLSKLYTLLTVLLTCQLCRVVP